MFNTSLEHVRKFPRLQDFGTFGADNKDGIVSQAALSHYLTSGEANYARKVAVSDHGAERSQRYSETDFSDLIDMMSNSMYTTKSMILQGETGTSERKELNLGTEAKSAAVHDATEPMRSLGVGASRIPPKRFYRTFWRAMARKALERAEPAARS
jgi:hypothetical protein